MSIQVFISNKKYNILLLFIHCTNIPQNIIFIQLFNSYKKNAKEKYFEQSDLSVVTINELSLGDRKVIARGRTRDTPRLLQPIITC